jgi:hypothetical protein
MTSTTLDKNRTDQTEAEDQACAEERDAKEIADSLSRKAQEKQERAEQRKNREPSRLLQALGTLRPGQRGQGRGGRIGLAFWSLALRSIVLISFYLIAAVTAQAIIPALALWLHQESGATMGQLTAEGTIAMWVMPLLFMVAMLVAAELAVMRAMWRWSSRMITKLHAPSAEVEDAQTIEPARTARPKSTTTTRQSKTNRKRSK